MNLVIEPNMELKEMTDKYNDRKLLWTNFDKFETLSKTWHEDNFLSLDVEDVERQMKLFSGGIM